ncbi:uncharacterized protein [Periplaneta americana]|uniref:uncharacterized protein n=1 Tax=Periplaneta americana TaxID=6978 RepID=UPI0037E7ED81
MICSVLNIPQPPTKFSAYNKTLLSAVAEVSEGSMLNAAREAIELNVSNDDDDDNDYNVRNIAAAFDCSWQKRGHTSLNGIVSATSFDTGKIIDVEILSKFCYICSTTPSLHHNCKKNYEGSSGGMEVAGVDKLFKRSLGVRGVRYTRYLGDGDCKAFQTVVKEEPYGPKCKIQKLECIGHVQKRMGSRLMKLVKEYSGKKLHDGRTLGGKGGLTKAQIDKIQNYYGLGIRRHPNNLAAMKKAIWAIYFHKLSTDSSPQHGLCPSGPDSWCKYNRAAITGVVHKHKNSLPESVMTTIKPIFRALSNEDLLKKCLHGKTQNPNESFNSVIWRRIPKTDFVRLETLKLGVHDAVLSFNNGVSKKIDVLNLLGVRYGSNTFSGLRRIDMERVRKAEITMQNATKEARKEKEGRKGGGKIRRTWMIQHMVLECINWINFRTRLPSFYHCHMMN